MRGKLKLGLYFLYMLRFWRYLRKMKTRWRRRVCAKQPSLKTRCFCIIKIYPYIQTRVETPTANKRHNAEARKKIGIMFIYWIILSIQIIVCSLQTAGDGSTKNEKRGGFEIHECRIPMPPKHDSQTLLARWGNAGSGRRGLGHTVVADRDPLDAIFEVLGHHCGGGLGDGSQDRKGGNWTGLCWAGLWMFTLKGIYYCSA